MVSEKYKVLGMSDSPNVITGYANMARNLFTRLQDDDRFDLSFLGLQFSGQPTEYMKLENGPLLNFRMLPTGSARFGEDMLPFYLQKYKPDLTYVLLDSFMVQWMLNLDWSPTKMLMHFPSDGFPIPAGSEPLMKKFDYVVAMSKFAQKQLVDLGIDASYIPAGVETNKFYPLRENEKIKIKEKWSQLLQIDLNNKFVIGCVGRMQGRKFYGELLKAVEKFVEDKNDVVLIIHADPNDPANPGFILPELIKLRKLEHLIRFTGNRYTLGFTEKEMNEVYNLFDVFALTSSGEGFGIPFIESMACEVPIITTDFTTVQEIITDNNAGIAVPIMNTITGTYNVERGIADLDKFVEALQSLYDNPIERKRLGKNGRTATIRDYDWSKVVYPTWNKYLLKVLDG